MAQPSARLEAEDTLPPFFIVGIPPIGFGPPVIGAGPGGLIPDIPPIGLGVIGVAGAPVTVGFTPAIGIGAGPIGLIPGLAGAAGIGVGLTPGANLISSFL